MSEVMRLFVAVAPGEASRELLAREARRIAGLDRAIRAVRAENMHFTVAFLGATPTEEVAAIEVALRDVARRVEPMQIRIAGLGAFPSVHRPRVVWAGVEVGGESTRLAELARETTAALETAGHRVDAAERFHPHVTLARVDGTPRNPVVEKVLTAGTLQDTYSPEVLSDLLFMVSENDGRGTRYRPLATIPLGSG